MPMKIPTRCRYPGCPHTARSRYCDAHRGTDTRYSDARRGTPTERGYDRHWRYVSQQRYLADECVCQQCLRDGRRIHSRLVDHIIPVHVRPDWRLELDNTQVLCSSCHQRKTQEDNRRYGSSTQTRLTPDQQAARLAVQRLEGPPRAGERETYPGSTGSREGPQGKVIML